MVAASARASFERSTSTSKTPSGATDQSAQMQLASQSPRTVSPLTKLSSSESISPVGVERLAAEPSLLPSKIQPASSVSAVKPIDPPKKALSVDAYKLKFSSQKVIVIHLSKSDGGLGLGIRGGTSTAATAGIYVENIVEGGSAHVEGSLRIKDRILAVNEADLTDASKSEAIKVLKSTQEQVTLVVSRSKSSAEPVSDL